MDERKLYQMVDFILNEADSGELDVIRAALRKREGRGTPDGSADLGQRIGRMAKDMAEQVSGQVGVSEGQIRQTVRGFVKDMISREAPELGEAQVEELLDRCVADPRSQGGAAGSEKGATDTGGVGGRQSGGDANAGVSRDKAAGGPGDSAEDRSGAKRRPSGEGGLPQDALLTMVRQFIAFSTGTMTESEDAELSRAIPNWQNRYWGRFSKVIQKLIGLHVKGIMSEQDFWEGVYDELGYEANGSSSGT